MVCLSGHRLQAAHLPHQPLINGNAISFSGTAKLTSFAGEILKDRARFKHRNWRTVWSVRVCDGGHAIVGGNGQKVWFELITRTDIDQIDAVGQAHFLKCDRDFSDVGRGPVIEINHDAGSFGVTMTDGRDQ